MSTPNASAAGTIDLGGDLTVNRLGFGAMRITGDGIWGEPKSREVRGPNLAARLPSHQPAGMARDLHTE